MRSSIRSNRANGSPRSRATTIPSVLTTGNGIDDPDQAFYENYGCGSERNYTHYCNKELEALFDKQSVESDVEKRKKMVWDIDMKLQEDVARPILMHAR